MGKFPANSGACCLPDVNGITYINVGRQGHPVGMRGLETIFQQLYRMGRRPEDATDDELVGMARMYNWIANKTSIEADYAVALRKAYAAFYDRQEKQK